MSYIEILVAVAVIVMALLVFRSLKKSSQNLSQDIREEMDPESRSLFAPIKRLVEEIEAIVARNSDSPIMKVVGTEAVAESERIREQVGKALAVRDDLKRAMREKNMALRDIEDLREKVERADDVTRPALESALEARQLELTHYAVVEQALIKIDSGVTQAQAALAEMKARLSVKASSEKASLSHEEDELRETIGRMRSLSISYDEAEQLLQG